VKIAAWTQPEREIRGSLAERLAALPMQLILTAGAAILYLVLLSSNYSGEGIRWYRAATASSPPAAGGPRHLLYPLLQWGWHRLLLLVGVGDSSIVANVAHLQALNAISGAAAVGLFYALLRDLDVDSLTATAGTLLLMVSYVFAALATDMIEVMPSLTLALAALLLAVHARHVCGARAVALHTAGAAGSLALGTVIHQTALLLGPSIAFAFAYGHVYDVPWQGWKRLGLRLAKQPAVWAFGALTLAFLVAIYLGTALALVTNNPGDAIAYATGTPETIDYSPFSPLHVLAAVFGWANGVFGLVGWTNGTNLLHGGVRLTTLYNVGAVLATLLLALGVLLVGVRVFREQSDRIYGWAVLLVAFVVPAAFAAFTWSVYVKLWLSPSVAWIGLLTLTLLDVRSRISARRASPSLRLVAPAAMGLLALVLAVGVGVHLIPTHITTDAYLPEAEYLGQLVGPNDLLLAHGWDGVGERFVLFYNEPYISFMQEGANVNFQTDALVGDLEGAVRKTQARGGKVYTIDILDQPRSAWDPFFLQRLHVPYDALDRLRQAAQPLATAPKGLPEPVMVLAPLGS